MSNKKRILLLGGNGFIGTNLLEYLLEREYKVSVYDRGDSTFVDRFPEVDYSYGELGNTGLLAEALNGVDIVYHLVSTTIPATSNEDPAFDVTSNIAGSVRMLEECIVAKVKKIIFVSSGGTVYGVPRVLPIPETHPTDPICSYGISKLAVEKYLALFNHLYGLAYVVIRAGNPYGPYQNPLAEQGAVSVFAKRMIAGEPIVIWGDGEIVRDYFYVGDLVVALELLARDHSPANSIYNIGSGTGLSLNQVILGLEQYTGQKADVHYEAGRKVDVPSVVLDVTKAEKELGWRPTTSLSVGLIPTVEWLRRVVSS